MPDPRLNCAAEICCQPPQAREALVSILLDIGVPEEYVRRCAVKMTEMGIAFTSVEMMKAVAEIVDHPGRGSA